MRSKSNNFTFTIILTPLCISFPVLYTKWCSPKTTFMSASVYLEHKNIKKSFSTSSVMKKAGYVLGDLKEKQPNVCSRSKVDLIK